KTSSWTRVLSQPATTDYLVRIALENPQAVYLAERGGKKLFYSSSGGDEEWFARNCALDVQDMAAESTTVIYVLNREGKVTKSSNSGSTWLGEVSTGFSEDTGHMIISVSKDVLLAGSTNGYVAYSTNGNLSWEKIPQILQPSAGKVQVVADSDFENNKTIYAASDTPTQNIYKWTIGTSNAWTDIFRGVFHGRIYGLSMRNETFYALEYSNDINQNTLWQCLDPGSATGTSSSWRARTTTDPSVYFNAVPRALKEGPGNELWTIKTNSNNALYRFTSVLTDLKLQSPPAGFSNPVNPITGIANEIAFVWERYADATEYKLHLAYDAGFSEIISAITVTDDSETVVVNVGHNREGDARISFLPGIRYYWRVQITDPIVSPHSQTSNFIVAPLASAVTELFVPQNGEIGTRQTPSFSWSSLTDDTEYRFVLDDNADLTSPHIDVTLSQPSYAVTQALNFGKTYFWAVKPEGGDWSATGIFTVRDKPVEPVPPVIIREMPPVVIDFPPLAPPTPPEIELPPLSSPQPATPGYAWGIIGIGTLLMAIVILLVLKPTLFAYVFYGREKQGPQRTKNISFAAKAFFWMLTTESKELLLNSAEEQKLGRIIASKVRAMTAGKPLYLNFPADAPVFLEIWARYGSREETDSYLSHSFQSSPHNVVEFLKCYLKPDSDAESNLRHYEAITRVIDPKKIITSIFSHYGQTLEKLLPGTPERLTIDTFLNYFERN
ncbi:WD40/YVTN/BNR-like repeat-containing protein, partial [Chloroflexota bacterium]